MSRLPRLNWVHLTLLIAALSVHGLLLLNDGVYVDGWLFSTYFTEGRWDLLLEFFAKQGIPHAAYLYSVLNLFPDFLLAFKIIAFVCLLFAAVFTYAIARELQLFSKYEGLMLALLTLAYPSYQFAVEISHLWNLLPATIFLAAWLLALRAERWQANGHTAKHVFFRMSGLLLLVLSFMNASLLTYYFGFLFVYLVHSSRQQHLTRDEIPRHLVSRLDFLLLPIVYWLLARLFFPSHGVFADYNVIDSSAIIVPASWWQFLQNGILAQIWRAYTALPLLFLLFAAVAYLFINAKYRLEEVSFFACRVKPTVMVGYGLGLLILGMIPFIVVGKLPDLHGFNTRVTLLLGLPMAIITLALVRALFSISSNRLHRSGALFLITMLIAFGVAHIDVYFAWQARWVKDRSILLNLETLEEARAHTTLYIDDQYLFKSRDGSVDPTSQLLNRRYFQEWVGMFRTVYGDKEGHLGMDIVFFEPTYHYHRWIMVLKERTAGPGEDIFLLGNYAPSGCQARLNIRQTVSAAKMSKLGVSRRYWQYRFLQPEKLNDFLRSLTMFELEPIEIDQAPDCRLLFQ